MKGFTLSTTAIVILILAAVVLAAILYFIFFQAASEMTQAEANSIFYGKCSDYRARKCDWAVTYEEDFGRFVQACRHLFGTFRDSYSCLYSMCPDCKELNLGDVKCSGLCRLCEGNHYASIKTKDCCLRYKNECSTGCELCDAIEQ